MSTQYLTRAEGLPVPQYSAADMAQGLYAGLARFLAPVLIELDRRLDKRLIRTLLQTVQVIVAFRDRVNGLLLSELGGYLETPDKAPAGTKRLSRRFALRQMVGGTDPRVSVGAGHAAVEEVARGRGGGAGHLG
jgi:hypothetical protein